ncbi:MAG: molybdopterin molybdotransferase MoeA [Alphaproteobacteria bacterium]|nr:molybdopterin molybdotransferase MoeA [Alphaproteobacteria bacterium]
MNVPWVTVQRKPRVAILATGDELVMPGEAVGASQIISSNSLSIAAYVRELGGDPINLGIAQDSEESLRKMLDGAKGADLLITIGGASVGDHDLVRRVLDGEGFDLNFFRVAMRPGKPLIFGKLGRVPVLGLPGNPVSAGVTAVIFLRPAMNIMLGIAASDAPEETAQLGRDVTANDQRQDYLRATLSVDEAGRRTATPFDAQDSAMMARLAAADCLIIRPPHAEPAKAGDTVEIIPL